MTISLKFDVEEFTHRNFNVPALELYSPIVYEGPKLEREYMLPKAPLAWKAALFMVGSDLKFSPDVVENLPDSVKIAGRKVYHDCAMTKRESVYDVRESHNDCVLFMPKSHAPKGMRQPNGDYHLARYFKDVKALYPSGDDCEWKVEPSPLTKETIIWLPKNQGYVVPTMDGMYHPDTGTPFETIILKERIDDWDCPPFLSFEEQAKVISRFYKAGFSRDQAKHDISKFFVPYNPDSSMYMVNSQSSGNSGIFSIRIKDKLPPFYDISDIDTKFSAKRTDAEELSLVLSSILDG